MSLQLMRCWLVFVNIGAPAAFLWERGKKIAKLFWSSAAQWCTRGHYKWNKNRQNLLLPDTAAKYCGDTVLLWQNKVRISHVKANLSTLEHQLELVLGNAVTCHSAVAATLFLSRMALAQSSSKTTHHSWAARLLFCTHDHIAEQFWSGQCPLVDKALVLGQSLPF